jgi:ferrous iron transport protein A
MCIHEINGESFPLSLAAEGERVRISAVNGGRGVFGKLTEMGLLIGSEVTVIHRNGGGPIVVARKDGRIALGAGMAHRIVVSPVTENG